MNSPKTIHESIRSRPGMYIGSSYRSGISYLINQLLIDVLNRVKCKRIDIFIFRNNTICVQFELSNLGDEKKLKSFFTKKEIFGKSWSLGKASAIALSEHFSVAALGETCEYSNNHRVLKKYKLESHKKGRVSVAFRLSKKYLNEITPDNKSLPEYLLTLAVCNPGLKTVYVDKTTSPFTRIVHNFPNGTIDMMRSISLNTNSGYVYVHQLQFKSETISADIAFCINKYIGARHWSAMNDQFTKENGTHVDGVVQGCLSFAKAVVKKQKINTSVTGYYKSFSKRVEVVVAARSEVAEYLGATKWSVGNPEFISLISRAVKEYLEIHYQNNPEEAKAFFR